MRKIILIFIHGCLLICSSFVAAVQLRAHYPQEYHVKEGDTLWHIADQFLNDPWSWSKLWHKNPSIDNPHLIYPGDTLRLSVVANQPSMEISRGRHLVVSPQVRNVQQVKAIPTLPLEIIWPFLSRPQIINPQEMRGLPYVLSNQEGHLISSDGDRVYIRGLQGQYAHRYAVVRCGETYLANTATSVSQVRHEYSKSWQADNRCFARQHRDPSEILGIEASRVADVEIERPGDPATAIIINSIQEVREGDRILPYDDEPYHDFYPQMPQLTVHGRILAIKDALSSVGPYQIVTLNLGIQQGLRSGDMLAIDRIGAVVEDRVNHEKAGFLRDNRNLRINLPSEEIGLLMVIKTYTQLSYGLILKASRGVHLGDAVRNPTELNPNIFN